MGKKDKKSASELARQDKALLKICLETKLEELDKRVIEVEKCVEGTRREKETILCVIRKMDGQIDFLEKYLELNIRPDIERIKKKIRLCKDFLDKT